MCDSFGWRPINGGHPIRGRGSQHGLLRGCHVPSLDVISKLLLFFRSVARSAQASAWWSFSKAQLLLPASSNVVVERESQRLEERRPPHDPGALSADSSLALLLRQPEAFGLPWSYDRLTPPTFAQANVGQRRVPCENPNWRAQSLSPTVATLAVLRLYHSAYTFTTEAAGMRGGPDINLRDL